MGQIQGTLEVTIVEGRNLKNQDMIGKNDAYVEAYLNEKEKLRTLAIPNTNDPMWSQKFTFNLQKESDFLYLNVYDKDVIGRDAIGSAKIDLKKNLSSKGRYEEWIPLLGASNEFSNGEIHVILRHHP